MSKTQDPHHLEARSTAVDGIAVHQQFRCSVASAEAIRRLVEIGLKAKK